MNSKEHSNERTPSDQEIFSDLQRPIFPILSNLWWKVTCYVGTLSGYIEVPL